jgi:ribulose 1,5-bisphosphate synthetase/thiazole synthase
VEPHVVEDCDVVVVSDGGVSDNTLARELAESDVSIHVIGDAARVGGVYDATMQAQVLARSL